MKRSQWGWDILQDELDAFRRELPKELSKVTRAHFNESFDKEALDNFKWEEVQRRIPGTYAYNHPRNVATGGRSRKILTGETGNLRDSVKNSEDYVGRSLVRLVSRVPYASYHNKGTDRMPRRPFMVQTSKLTKIQIETITDSLTKHLNKAQRRINNANL